MQTKSDARRQQAWLFIQVSDGKEKSCEPIRMGASSRLLWVPRHMYERVGASFLPILAGCCGQTPRSNPEHRDRVPTAACCQLITISFNRRQMGGNGKSVVRRSFFSFVFIRAMGGLSLTTFRKAISTATLHARHNHECHAYCSSSCSNRYLDSVLFLYICLAALARSARASRRLNLASSITPGNAC